MAILFVSFDAVAVTIFAFADAFVDIMLKQWLSSWSFDGFAHEFMHARSVNKQRNMLIL